MGLKSSHWSCLKAWFKGSTFCFRGFLVRPSTGAQRSHERAPKKVQMTLKGQSVVKKFKVSSTSSKFRLCASLKTCDLQILGNAQKCPTLVRKNIFSLKFWTLCKVSVADGIWLQHGHVDAFNFTLTLTVQLKRETCYKIVTNWADKSSLPFSST